MAPRPHAPTSPCKLPETLDWKCSYLQLVEKHQLHCSLMLKESFAELRDFLEIADGPDQLRNGHAIDVANVRDLQHSADDQDNTRHSEHGWIAQEPHKYYAVTIAPNKRIVSDSKSDGSCSIRNSSGARNASNASEDRVGSIINGSEQRQELKKSESKRSGVSLAHSDASGMSEKLRQMNNAREAQASIALQHMENIDQKLSLRKEHHKLDLVMGLVIAVNALVMMTTLEFQGTVSAVQLGLWNEHAWEAYGDVSEVAEHVFTALYLVELGFRLWQDGLSYFKSCFNIFDFFLIMLTAIESWLLSPFLNNNSSSNNSNNSVLTLRILRAVKLLRAARLIRAVRLFRGLRQMVTACASSTVALFWSMVLLALCITTAGLMMGNLMQDFINDRSNPYESRVWVWKHYGTAFQSIYTLFEITFAGNWPIYARPVLDMVSPLFVCFFAVYVSVVVFAVTRVIGAIFLKDAMDATNSDPELKFHTKGAQNRKYMQKITEFFEAIDTTHDGNITRAELDNMLKSQTVLAYLSVLDIEIHEAEPLFDMIDDDGSGAITFEKFAKGLLRFKGPARSLDLIELNMQIKALQQQFSEVLGRLQHT